MMTMAIALGGCQAVIENSLVALGKEELAITSIERIQNKKNGRTVYDSSIAFSR